MKNDLWPHCDDRAVGEVEAVVEISRFGDDRRPGNRFQRYRLLFRDGLELVANDLERDRVNCRTLSRKRCRVVSHCWVCISSMRRLPALSITAVWDGPT